MNDTPGGNRSQVCRMLLHQALGNDLAKAAVQEALFEFAAIRKRVLAKLSANMSAQMATIFEEATRDLPDTED